MTPDPGEGRRSDQDAAHAGALAEGHALRNHPGHRGRALPLEKVGYLERADRGDSAAKARAIECY